MPPNQPTWGSVRWPAVAHSVTLSSPMAQAPAGTEPLDTLLARFADGDRSAFDPLFSTAWPLVVRFCRRYLSEPADAEDAAQRAMIKLAEQAPRYDKERPAIGWILALAVWECRTTRRSHLRARARQSPLEALDGVSAEAGDPEEMVVRRQLCEALLAAVGDLPELDRQTLLDDLAEHVEQGLGGATRRKRRQRALTRLRAMWKVTHGS